ncbi:MAG TPA: hypothetical protein ENL43_02120 [candidate division WOR-3 bacterium]|uniref:Uncharacterized protein n=1 Tax=candidate division WOR-3 bacterium TaxID=2052148 RepID=A0A7V5LTB9_UNCW3|nr:hypothetical protein [candidate division WOR-3 bacterium]
MSIFLSTLISALFLKNIIVEDSKLLNQLDIRYLNQTLSGKEYKTDSTLIHKVLDETFKLYEDKGVIKVHIFPELKSSVKDTVVLIIHPTNEKVNPILNIKFKGIKKTNLRILKKFFSFKINIFSRKELFNKSSIFQSEDILILRGYNFVNLENGVELILNFEEVGGDFVHGIASFSNETPTVELEAGSQNFLGWMLKPSLSLYYRQNVLDALDFKLFMLFPLEPHYTIGCRVHYEPDGDEYGVYVRRSFINHSLWVGGENYRGSYRMNSGVIFSISSVYVLSNIIMNETKKLSGGGLARIVLEGRTYADVSALFVYNLDRRRVRVETGENYITGNGLSLRTKVGYGTLRVVFYRGIIDISAAGFEVPYKNGIFSLYIRPAKNLRSFEDYTFSLGFLKKEALFDNIFIFR